MQWMIFMSVYIEFNFSENKPFFIFLGVFVFIFYYVLLYKKKLVHLLCSLLCLSTNKFSYTVYKDVVNNSINVLTPLKDEHKKRYFMFIIPLLFLPFAHWSEILKLKLLFIFYAHCISYPTTNNNELFLSRK